MGGRIQANLRTAVLRVNCSVGCKIGNLSVLPTLAGAGYDFVFDDTESCAGATNCSMIRWRRRVHLQADALHQNLLTTLKQELVAEYQARLQSRKRSAHGNDRYNGPSPKKRRHNNFG